MAQSLMAFTIAVTLCTAFTLPKTYGDNNRVVDKSLSDQEHFMDGEHNPKYDHEAFLGEDAKQFDDLTPEESRRRLGLIFDKIDKTKDGFVDKDELRKWIEWTQKRYFIQDAQQQWRVQNPQGKTKIYWTEYKKSNYDFLDTEPEGSSEKQVYVKMQERDRRRWKMADADSDDALTETEFLNFIHPEDASHMQDVVVMETIEDIDKDGDGQISIAEYISDLYRGEPGDEEPTWVENERDSFRTYRDKNNDGVLDHDEVKQWIMPDEYDHAEAESNHLIHTSDTDADGKLSKEEVLEKYDVFVGSQATDFGEALVKHDEF
ncbi:Calumenin [Orchesella cincta]|uniref:Reticulocalbin-3 n=1 Tax=Orchesella cincta TaxID=48709 RepID=A0A1D2MWB2_ORCCI|nr:Calumenin [Orchesella cincta]